MTPPGLSVIVVFRDMVREAPRTLFTLSEAYQRGVDPSAYEVIAVDAGRNLAVLVEAAVRNTVLQLRGIDTYQEFIRRHQAAMDKGAPE